MYQKLFDTYKKCYPEKRAEWIDEDEVNGNFTNEEKNTSLPMADVTIVTSDGGI